MVAREPGEEYPSNLPEDARDQIGEILLGNTSYRHYDPGDFAQAAAICEEQLDGRQERLCKSDVRVAYGRMESGRWRDTMREAHNMWSNLDHDERERLQRKTGDLVDRVQEFSQVMEVNPVERV